MPIPPGSSERRIHEESDSHRTVRRNGRTRFSMPGILHGFAVSHPCLIQLILSIVVFFTYQ